MSEVINSKISPESFVRALLAVSPEDAAEVREIADVKAKPSANADKKTAPSAESTGGR